MPAFIRGYGIWYLSSYLTRLFAPDGSIIRRCNGVIDCPNAADEKNCSKCSMSISDMSITHLSHETDYDGAHANIYFLIAHLYGLSKAQNTVGSPVGSKKLTKKKRKVYTVVPRSFDRRHVLLISKHAPVSASF